MIKKKKDGTYDGSVKSEFKTFKLPLKRIFNPEYLPKLEEVIIRLNDLVFHTYNFIKLFVLYCYHNKIEYKIDKQFVRYCIRVLGDCKKTKDVKNKTLLDKMTKFYDEEYEKTVNHIKIDLNLLSHFTANIAIEIFTCISNNIKEYKLEPI